MRWSGELLVSGQSTNLFLSKSRVRNSDYGKSEWPNKTSPSENRATFVHIAPGLDEGQRRVGPGQTQTPLALGVLLLRLWRLFSGSLARVVVTWKDWSEDQRSLSFEIFARALIFLFASSSGALSKLAIRR